MKRSNKPCEKAQKPGGKRVHFSRAVEYLERWAANHADVEFVLRCASCAPVYAGVVIAKEGLLEMKSFDFIARSGMRVLLVPSLWERVQTRKNPAETIEVTSKASTAEGFLLHLPFLQLQANETLRDAEEQLRNWAKTNREIVVNFGLSFFSFFFCGKVLELGPRQFGFKDPQRGGLCTAIPQLCDHLNVERSEGHTTVKMIDRRTGSWFEVTDCVSRPEDVLTGFAMMSANKQ